MYTQRCFQSSVLVLESRQFQDPPGIYFSDIGCGLAGMGCGVKQAAHGA